MFCSKCGKQNSDDAKYCSACGAKLLDVSDKPVYKDTPKLAIIQPKPKKGWGVTSWVFIVLQILLLAFFFINLIFTDFSNPEPVNIIFGGWIVYLFALPIGLFVIFTESFLAVLFGIIQVCVNKKSVFSWVTFGVSVAMFAIMLILTMAGVFSMAVL